MNFDLSPEKLREPFSVSALVREPILAERVYRDCHVFVSHNSTMTDLIKLDMIDFDVILHACYASIDCRTQVFKFQIHNDLFIKWATSSTVPKVHFISYLKARNLVLRGISITF